MEPNLITDPRLLDVLNELKAREPIFHHPEFELHAPILTT